MTKVVLADDDAEILETTCALLELNGFSVVGVEDPRQILRTVRDERPDIVLQDVHMPNFDVADLLRKIRADPDVGGTPVLLFTASLQDEELWKAVDADGIIRKPFDAAKLERTIRAHLRRRA